MLLDTLRTVLIEELRELYAAEVMLEDALGRLSKAANSKELQLALQEHQELTTGHARRLEAIFRDVRESPRGGRAGSMKALLAEGEDQLGSGGSEHALDASLIATGRRVEHWEVAGYETAAIFAERLGLDQSAALLRLTLEDETAAASRLETIAFSLPVDGQSKA